jgi:hypothetical protein
VWSRFIDEGTQDPSLALALCARAEPAAIAAVGLDLHRHDRAATFLLDRLRDPSLSDEQRAQVAFFALELVEERGPLADACVAAVKEAPLERQPSDESIRRPWHTDYFWTPRSHLEPNTPGSVDPLRVVLPPENVVA